jgi:hypothetical protein
MRSWIAKHYGVRIMRWLYGRSSEPSYEVTFTSRVDGQAPWKRATIPHHLESDWKASR